MFRFFSKRQLPHFSHDHPLTFHNGSNYARMCKGCGERLWRSPRYSYGKCNFYLHQSCFELPLELQHVVHSEHPLKLQQKPPCEGGTCRCSCCNITCKFFVKHCSLCKFNLDIKCALLQPTIESEIHDHPLTLFGKLISFTCDCCDKEGNSMPYLCGRNCGFWVHHNCASLPRMVKSIRHKHPLNFTNSIKADDSEQRLCQLCVKMVDTNHGVDYCSRCHYVAHLDCATNKEGMDETFMQKLKGKDPIESIIMLEYEDLSFDGFTKEISYIVKRTEGEDKIEMAIEIKHFGHEHDLKLTKELENYVICDGCIQPIFPPFYSCAQCNFFLHKSCVELPTKMRHPLHQHPLILRLRRPKLGMCNACSCLSNGLTYVCNACNFSLDVSCSLMPERLTHDGHKHLLIFSSSTSTEKCSACNSESKIFRCSKCEFILNFKYATLPHTMKYEQHEHLFTLHYTVEDNSSEYYCDICEAERDAKNWFYYCVDCDYLAHPHCIFGYAKIDKEDF